MFTQQMNDEVVHIFLFIGLPGSGKTYLSNITCDFVVDDITNLEELPKKENIIGEKLGICDVNFCDESILVEAIKKLKKIYGNPVISKIYFENSEQKCRRNVAFRNDGRNVEGTFRRFSKIYNPPSPAMEVWSCDEM